MLSYSLWWFSCSVWSLFSQSYCMDKTQYKQQLNYSQAKFPITQVFVGWLATLKKNVKLSIVWLFSVEVLGMVSLFHLPINFIEFSNLWDFTMWLNLASMFQNYALWKWVRDIKYNCVRLVPWQNKLKNYIIYSFLVARINMLLV